VSSTCAQALSSLPEVRSVFGKIGRAETPTDPAPLSMVETVIQLKLPSEWPKTHHDRWCSGWAPSWMRGALGVVWPEEQAETWDELIARMNAKICSITASRLVSRRRPAWS
jgi:Cu(I)/Ag(I) efflux system membrane protein CusA/SilA